MRDWFRWALLTAFVVSLVTFLLSMVSRTGMIHVVVVLALTIGSIYWGSKKHGVPDSAFQAGGVLAMAALAGMLIGNAMREILEYMIVIVLFIAAYYIGGFFARWAIKKPKEPL